MIRIRLFGVLITIDFWFVAMLTLFLIFSKNSIAILSIIVCLSHELGHIFAFMLFKLKPQHLSFEASGICLNANISGIITYKEVIILLAGSGVNILTFMLFSNTILGQVHLIIGIFNLLPLKGLDGGKLLSILFRTKMSANASYYCSYVINIITVITLAIFILYLFIFNMLDILLIGVMIIITILSRV